MQFGASDKMLSTYDIEFEPSERQAKKIFAVTNSIAIMTAGGSSLHALLLPKITAFVNSWLVSQPKKWIPVVDIANEYRDAYVDLRKEAAERNYLNPYDLNYKTFISNQKYMTDEFVRDISFKIENFSFDPDEDISAIITGVDVDGPHIYVFTNNRVSCNDNVGFAAIGIGARHALSHLMLLGHSRFASEPETLVRVHRAKKKAEVSPGVGEKTDMFIIGPNPGTFYMLEPIGNLKIDIVKDLDESYKKDYEKGLAKLDTTDVATAKDYLAKLVKDNTPSQKKETPPLKEDKSVEEKSS